MRFFRTISISRSKVILRRAISLPNMSTQSSKLKLATVLAVFLSPIATASSALSFNQQLQLLKLQKDKLELELKVLIISRQERPPPPPHPITGLHILLFKTLRRPPSLDATSLTSIGRRILFLLFKVNAIR